MSPGAGSTSPLPGVPHSDDADSRSSSQPQQPLQIKTQDSTLPTQSLESDQSAVSSDDETDSDDPAPLFDPSGLGSSLSSGRNDDARGKQSQAATEIDLTSHAAFRLGISPQQRQASSGSYRSFSGGHPFASNVGHDPHSQSRGRRRRSEAAQGQDTSPPLSSDTSATTTSSFIGSAAGPREWWRRDPSKESSTGSFSNSRPSTRREHLSTSLYGSHPARMASDPGSNPSPAMATSTASAFLQSFSRSSSTAADAKHATSPDLKDSPTSAQAFFRSVNDPRAKSLSPTRSPEQPFASSPVDLSASGFQGLGGAAANLYQRQREPSNPESTDSAVSPTPDDEGFRFGPQLRYTLGKSLGYGGFSTIREGWDAARDPDGLPHKVAVKLTYRDMDTPATGDELSIWRNLPTHMHLLPLLYDERIVVERPGHSTTSSNGPLTAKQELELVVMPFCDAGNLLEFIRSEGGRKAAGEVPGGNLSRTPSVAQSLQHSADTAMTPLASGSVPRSPSAAHSPVSMQRVPSSTSVRSTSILRTSSMRGPRSQGVSLSTARSIAHQLAQALNCLHSTARVIHGDIKLENVLAQNTRNAKSQSSASLQTSSLCWRMADFGLSRKVEEPADTNAKHTRPNFERTISSASRISLRDSENQSRSNRPASGVENFGGSTAYSAPEIWRDDAHLTAYETVSPFAPDMWALGCVLYALMSGRLPFNDAFEPRLQAKIAKGEWDIPSRLWRRARRLAANASAGHRRSGHQRTPSAKSITDTSELTGASSMGNSPTKFAAGSPQKERRESTTGRNDELRVPSADLSASLPDLPSPGPQPTRLGLHNLASSGEAHTVGSVPSRPSAPDRYEIDEGAQATADAEADPESDEDTTVDQDWDGTSSERASAREALRGLLEPDPSLRWTIGRLMSSRWLRGSPEAERRNPFDAVGRGTAGRMSGVGSQRNVLSSVTEGVAVGEERRESTPIERGRSSRTETQSLQFEKVKPALATEADKSTSQGGRRPSSLSRSRPRHSDGSSRTTSPSRREDGEHRDLQRAKHLQALSTKSSQASLGDDTGSGSASMIIHDDEQGQQEGRASHSPPVEMRGRGRTRSRFMDEVKEDELLNQFGGPDDEAKRPRSRPRAIAFHPMSSRHGSNASSRSSSRGMTGDGAGDSRSKSTSRVGSTSSRRFYEYGSGSEEGCDQSDALSMDALAHRTKAKRSSSSSTSRRSASNSSTSGRWKGSGPPSLLSTSSGAVSGLSTARHSPHFAYGQASVEGEEDEAEDGGRERGRTSRRGKNVSASSGTSASTSRSRSRAPEALSQLLHGGNSSKGGHGHQHQQQQREGEMFDDGES